MSNSDKRFRNESTLADSIKKGKSATTLKLEEQQANIEKQRKAIAELNQKKSATALKFEQQQANLDQQRKAIAELEAKLQGFAPSEHDGAELERLKNEMKENEIKVQNAANELIEEKEKEKEKVKKENEKVKKQLQTAITIGVVTTVLTFVGFFIKN